MLRAGARVQHGLRWGALGLVAVIAATAFSSNAEARRRRSNYRPPTASIVVDVNSGKVLEASNADSPRHPASLTKIMTLYLLFEQLEAGKLKLSSKLEASAHAAALGFQCRSIGMLAPLGVQSSSKKSSITPPPPSPRRWRR